VLDQTLWRVPGSPNRALGFFARGVAAPRDRNEVDLYADSGFTFRGLVPRRPEDTIGLAFAYGRIFPMRQPLTARWRPAGNAYRYATMKRRSN
jgi:porin